MPSYAETAQTVYMMFKMGDCFFFCLVVWIIAAITLWVLNKWNHTK